jgi:hypothetical protein
MVAIGSILMHEVLMYENLLSVLLSTPMSGNNDISYPMQMMC